MSSGFVRGGPGDQPAERGSDWAKAQQQIEAARRRKEADGKQEGGKSLYEVLQANKASKQEAFEESARLKNQFRALEEDEVEFLDSVLESTRANEAAVKKETSEQLETFRKQRQAADAALLAQSPTGQAESTTQADAWAVQKKRRRRGQVKDNPAAKLRKLSSSDHQALAAAGDSETPDPSKSSPSVAKSPEQLPESATEEENTFKKPVTDLGLGGYSSEDE